MPKCSKKVRTSTLWMLHHIFDDQWTFDGSRGFKSSASAKDLNPIENLGYLTWLIQKIDERMNDIQLMSDPLHREQVCMTFSRAVCDSILSVSAELPYMAKVFFFACIDKLANLMVQLDLAQQEIDAWHNLVDPLFLQGNLANLLKQLPDSAGDYLRAIVDWISGIMKVDEVTPEVLRDIRNSHHGYELRPNVVSRLFSSSGELHNDITLICTPLVLFFLAQKWK